MTKEGVTACAALLSFLTLGCSAAGPFVTNISSDGAGGLLVEKCMVRHSQFTNSVSNDSCTTHRIAIGTASTTHREVVPHHAKPSVAPRIWTARSGSTLEATYLAQDATHVVLRLTDGRLKRAKKSNLVVADHKYLLTLR